MKALAAAAIMIVIAASAATGQDAGPRPELGFRSGMAVYFQEGDSFTVFSVPGGGFPMTPSTVYLTLFPRENLGVEPQFGLTYGRSSGSGSGMFSLALQFNQFIGDSVEDAPFGFVTGGFIAPFGSSGGDPLWTIGGGAGYRTIIRESLGARIEARYRRLQDRNDYGVNEISLLIGIGALIGSE